MSTEKKILFLFLALIVLIITCVFTHLDKFKTEEPVSIETSQESSNIFEGILNRVKSITSVDEVVEKKEFEEEKVEQNIEENEVIEESKSLQNIEVNDEETLPTNELEEEKSDIEDITEEIKEELEKPLITTDKRYKREGSEKKIEELSKEAQLLQIKMTEYIKENPITFKRASEKIIKSSDKTIKKVVEALKESPNMKIEVAGHTDAAGGAKLNQAISQKRANSVKQRLIDYGIDKSRIKARGYGESIPLVKNSPNGYSKINRRVEFNIVEE